MPFLQLFVGEIFSFAVKADINVCSKQSNTNAFIYFKSIGVDHERIFEFEFLCLRGVVKGKKKVAQMNDLSLISFKTYSTGSTGTAAGAVG